MKIDQFVVKAVNRSSFPTFERTALRYCCPLSEIAEHNAKYHFRDGNVIFLVSFIFRYASCRCRSITRYQVGNVLFEIHQYRLEGSESSIFCALFTLPTPNNS